MKQITQLSLILVILLNVSASIYQKKWQEPILKVGTNLSDMTFSDQFDENHKIELSTKRLIIALDKEPAHAVNEYLDRKDPNFLEENQSLFIVDVSAAPKIIQKVFILPGLKKFDYPVLIFTDEDEAKPFRQAVNTAKVLEVTLKNQKITAVKEHQATIDAVQAIF